jgi:hypothetical protein
MTSFLNSLKADLLDRRLLPLVVLVVVALVAAIGYVVVGGGSHASTPAGPAGVIPAGPPTGISVSEIHPEKAVAETTGGGSQRHNKGVAGDPFTPLPEAKEKTTKTVAPNAPASSSSTPTSSTGSSPSPSSPSESSPPPNPAPAKPKLVYHVAVLFGVPPTPGAPEGEQQLTPYENLKLLSPLPSASAPLIVYRGVTAKGKSATFTIVGEVILNGQAKCLPSEAQCTTIELNPGQGETFEFTTASGQPVVDELKLVSITASNGSSANVESVLRGESKAGRELLKHEGLVELPGLRYSARQGVLVLAGHAGFSGHAHRR